MKPDSRRAVGNPAWCGDLRRESHLVWRRRQESGLVRRLRRARAWRGCVRRESGFVWRRRQESGLVQRISSGIALGEAISAAFRLGAAPDASPIPFLTRPASRSLNPAEDPLEVDFQQIDPHTQSSRWQTATDAGTARLFWNCFWTEPKRRARTQYGRANKALANELTRGPRARRR